MVSPTVSNSWYKLGRNILSDFNGFVLFRKGGGLQLQFD